MSEMNIDETKAPSLDAEPEKMRRNRTISLSLATSLLFLLLTAAFMPQVFSSDNPNYWGFALTLPVTAIGLICALMAWRNRVTQAASVLLATIFILSLATPIVGRGQGLSVGILVAILGIGIAVNTLPQRLVIRTIWIAVGFGVLIIIMDQYTPDFGLESNPLYTNISAIILSIIFLIIGARRFNAFTLRAKLIISFAGIVILPLLSLGIYNNETAKNTLTQESQTQLQELSEQAANVYDSFIEQQLVQIQTEAKLVPAIGYHLFPSSLSTDNEDLERANNALATFQRKDPIFIFSYAILDKNGRTVLSTNPNDLARDESKQPYFTALNNGEFASFASNVIFLDGSDGRLFFSAPIKDSRGNTLGVLRVSYFATVLQNLANSIVSDDINLNLALVDRASYLRLAYTGNRDELFKGYKDFSELELAALQAGGSLPFGTKNQLLMNINEDMITGIDNLTSQPVFKAYSPTFNSEATNAGTNLVNQPWSVIVQESVLINEDALRAQTRTIIFISLALAAFAIALAFGASQILAAPLVTLTRVAEKVSAGDTTARAEVITEDEVGTLAQTFNTMTEQLNRSLVTLEERVSQRTTDLELSRKQIEKRASELLAIGEISRLTSTEQKIEHLLPLVTRLVSERFDFYHVGIFLIDETKQFAVLHASNSEGGKLLIENGHKLEVGGSGIVGYVAKYGTSRIALDVGEDAVFFNNPYLPDTRSEMALPLNVRNQTVGVLDVQSKKAGAFTETDSGTLGILADQIGIAIENARLLEQTQRALNEFQTLYQQNIREGWAAFSREEPLIGYQQTLTGGKRVTTPIETMEIRDAINRGDVVVSQPKNEHDRSYIVVPVKLRGQIIGTLKVDAPTTNRTWSTDEINLAGAVSERLSIALENARLIEESQRQAIKEQTISEATSKIGASIDLKNVLQTAVEELGRAIPGSEVLIRFGSNGKNQGS